MLRMRHVDKGAALCAKPLLETKHSVCHGFQHTADDAEGSPVRWGGGRHAHMREHTGLITGTLRASLLTSSSQLLALGDQADLPDCRTSTGWRPLCAVG